MATQNIYALTDTWNNVATTFTGIGLNVTDTTSAATSMLIDLQIGGTTQFHVLKSGAVHTKRSNYNLTSANTAIITASNYSLTGTNAQSLVDLSGTWNTSGTPAAIKLNMTDTASNAASALMDLQVGGVSQFKVSKAGAVTAVGVAIPTISSSDTLSNKTLSSPTVSGTIAGTATWSGTQTFSTGLVLNHGSAVGVIYQKSSVNKWVNGVAAGTGTGDNYEIYNYTLGGNALVINSSTNAAAFGGAITAGAVTANSGTAIPAGGTAGAGLMVSSTANFGVFFGSGAPTLSAAKGSLYMRSDGSGINDRMYVNTNGSTTWTAVVTVA